MREARTVPQTVQEQLADRIDQRTARVAVVGLGAVGLPLCEALHAGGFHVTGLDSDDSHVANLSAGAFLVEQFGSSRAAALTESGRFQVSSSMDLLSSMHVVVISVPTPLTEAREPDLSNVREAAQACGRYLVEGQLFVLESTTYPGTTRNFFAPILEQAGATLGGLKRGEDFFVAYSPEREDPGRISHSTATMPKIVGALDPSSLRLAARFFRWSIEDVIEVSSAEIAESAKMLENIFRCVNIALVNEMKGSLEAMGVDIWEVIDAAATKPFGFMPFEPGPGLGGHCIPIDPFYFTWKAAKVGKPARLVEMAGNINTTMPSLVVERVVHALAKANVDADAASVLIVGVAYKPGVADTRESPSLELIRALARLGANVCFFDPYVQVIKSPLTAGQTMGSVPLTVSTLKRQDAVIIATAHEGVDYALIAEQAHLIIDTRNAIARAGLRTRGKLVKA